MYELRCHDPRYDLGYPHESSDDLKALLTQCDALNEQSRQTDGYEEWWVVHAGVIIYPPQFLAPVEGAEDATPEAQGQPAQAQAAQGTGPTNAPAPGSVWMTEGFTEGVVFFIREPEGEPSREVGEGS